MDKILFNGWESLLRTVIKKERIMIEEINNAARKKGFSQLSEIDVIVLETTGDITIIKDLTGSDETLRNVAQKKGRSVRTPM